MEKKNTLDFTVRLEPNFKSLYQYYYNSNYAEKDVDILFEPVYFDLGKSALRPESIRDLNKKAEVLKKHPEIRLIIFGNTCDLGNDTNNGKLGLERADAAKTYLMNKGIAAERLTRLFFFCWHVTVKKQSCRF